MRENLHAEVLPLDPSLVVPFLRSSYGPHYRGDAHILAYFKRVDKIVGLKDNLGELAAAAMIEEVSNNRVIAVATSPNVTRFGRRGSLMSRLLESCRDEGQARWISIGCQYRAMRLAAQKANMTRVPEVRKYWRIRVWILIMS